LPSDQVGLGLLSFGQFGLALLQHLIELGDLFYPGVNVDGNEPLRLLGLGYRDTTAFFIDLGGHLSVDGISGCGDLSLLVANGRFAVCDLGFFSGQLVLVPFSGGLDERRRERFRQLDRRSASWARECWFGHGCVSRNQGANPRWYRLLRSEICAVENDPQVTDCTGGSAGGHASARLR
jgi:hypothetical protein